MKLRPEEIINNLAAIPLILIPLVFTYRATHYYVPKVALAQVLGFGVLTAWLFFLAMKKPRTLVDASPTDAPALLFLAWTGISAAWAANRHVALETLVFLASLTAVYFYVSKSRPSLTVFSAAVSGAASIASLYGISQFLGKDFLVPAPAQHVSTFGNVNFAGEFIAAALFLTAGLLLSGAKRLKIYAACGAAFQLTYLMITGARGAWAGFLAGITVFFILAPRTGIRPVRAAIYVLSILAASVMLISAIGGREALDSTAARAYSAFDMRHPTVRVRINVWKSAMEIIRENPLAGSGAGNLGIAYPPFRRFEEVRLSGIVTRVERAHNDFIETAVDSGIIGLGIFLWLLAEWGKSVKKGADGKNPLHAGLAAGMACILASSLFGFPLRTPSTALLFWAGMGIVSRAGRGKKTFPLFPGNPSVIAAGAIVLFLLVSLHSGLRFAADTRVKKAMEHERLGEWEMMKHELEKSLIYYYPDIQAHNRLARAYIRLGDIENAYAQLNALMELHPNHAWAHRALGQIYFELDRREKGLELLQKAAKLNPVFMSYLGRALMLVGETDKAESVIIRQIREGFGDEYSYMYLGEIYEAKGEKAGALRAYRKALELNPGLGMPASRIEALENVQKGETDEHHGNSRPSR